MLFLALLPLGEARRRAGVPGGQVRLVHLRPLEEPALLRREPRADPRPPGAARLRGHGGEDRVLVQLQGHVIVDHSILYYIILYYISIVDKLYFTCSFVNL